MTTRNQHAHTHGACDTRRPKVLAGATRPEGAACGVVNKRPAPPPVYRPQPSHARSAPVQPKLSAARPAPPQAVCRPRPPHQVSQTKSAAGVQTPHACRQPRAPVAPPAYRPERGQTAQPKVAAGARPSPVSSQSPHVPRPRAAAGVLQTKTVAAAQTFARPGVVNAAPPFKNFSGARALRPAVSPCVPRVIQRMEDNKGVAEHNWDTVINGYADGTAEKIDNAFIEAGYTDPTARRNAILKALRQSKWGKRKIAHGLGNTNSGVRGGTLDEVEQCANYLIKWAATNGPNSKTSGTSFKAKPSKKKGGVDMFEALGELHTNTLVRVREPDSGKTLQQTRKEWARKALMGVKFKYGPEEAEETAENLFPTPRVITTTTTNNNNNNNTPTVTMEENILTMPFEQVQELARRRGLISGRTESRFEFAQDK